jgi:inorganic pyrophosphatase
MDISKVGPGRSVPDDIHCIIEVPLGGEPIKYEFDKESGALFVDRFLYTPMRYPVNYGFMPHTLGLDGDPLDIMVVGNRPLVPGAVLRVRPIGVLMMEDDGGRDEKVLCVPHQKLTRYYDRIHTYTDLPEESIDKIKHFFEHYKDLEPKKWVKIEGWHGVERAREIIVESLNRAKEAKA